MGFGIGRQGAGMGHSGSLGGVGLPPPPAGFAWVIYTDPNSGQQYIVTYTDPSTGAVGPAMVSLN